MLPYKEYIEVITTPFTLIFTIYAIVRSHLQSAFGGIKSENGTVGET